MTATADANAGAAAAAVTSSSAPAAARRDDSSQSSAAVRSLTTLLLKGQTLLLQAAVRQQVQNQQPMEGVGEVEGGGVRSGDGVSTTAPADDRPQTSTRVELVSLAFDEADATVNAVLAGFLDDLATNHALDRFVSAQGNSGDSDEADGLLTFDGSEDGDGSGGESTSNESNGVDGSGGVVPANNHTTSSRPGCLPALYAPPTRQPPKLLGGALVINFNGGECRVVRGLLPGTRKIECDSPSIEYAWVPPGFEWAHESAEMWAGLSCKGETTWCTGTIDNVRTDVPLVEDSGAPTSRSALCRAASKDSLIDSAFAENAAAFRNI
jgi:hypothetical protein